MQRQYSAGGVVYKNTASGFQFLLRKSAPSNNFYSKNPWSLPKGWLDDLGNQPGPYTLGQKRATPEKMQETALREVAEETGVSAKIISRLGSDQFTFVDQSGQKVFKTVSYFLMEYVADLPGGFGLETSEITWVDLSKATELLAKRKGEIMMITKALEILHDH